MERETRELIRAARRWRRVREAHDTAQEVTLANDDDAVEYAAQALESAIMRYDEAAGA